MSIGTRVRLLRDASGLTIDVFAKRAGIHRNTVIAVEHDRVDVGVSTLKKMASALGVEVSKLLRDPPTRQSQRKAS